MTAAQQQQLEALQAGYNEALANWQDSVNATAAARNAAQACQSARDQHSLGWKKNQACHIDTLGSLNSAWGQAAANEQARRAVKDAAYNAIADFQRSIDTAIQQGVDELQLDPDFNLQSQQIQANAATQVAVATAKEKAAAEAAAQKKKVVIIIVVVSILALAGIITAVIISRNKKAA